MGNKTKKPMGRRIAASLGVLGALVMSSGVALMVTATPANAAQKVTFCHSTESQSHPWNLITTSVNAFYQGHVLAQHTDDVYPAVSFVKKGVTINIPAQHYDAAFIANGCKNSEPEEPGLATATVEPTQATCDDDASYTATGDHVASFTESAEPAAGTTITVTAHAVEGFQFGNESATQDFPLSFDPAPTNCPTTVVSPPGGTTVVSPPKAHTPKAHTPKAKTPKAAVTTPTVVHAGLVGTSTQDLRGEQGLALMVAGMVMLAAAGGLGLRLRGAASRI
jgi:hypothetical protein